MTTLQWSLFDGNAGVEIYIGDSDVISSYQLFSAIVWCKALRNVCCSDVNRRHFLNKIAIIRTFS